jgi:hypothetical protein
MKLPTLEERVAALEETVAQFADDPVMREIDAEGRRIREADRQQAQS